MIRKFTLGVMVAAAVGASGGTATAADTFSAGATPAAAGPAAAPATTQTVVDVQLDTDAKGVPRDAATSIAFDLPADFASNLSKFDTCEAGKVLAAATGGPHAPPDCPETSKVGGGAITSSVPSIGVSRASTNRVFIYKSSETMLVAWFDVKKPAEVTGASIGQISPGSAPYGTTITWDFSLAANAAPITGGQKVYIVRWKNAFNKWKPAELKAAKRAACSAKAKKNNKPGKKRKAALAKCTRRFPVKPGPSK